MYNNNVAQLDKTKIRMINFIWLMHKQFGFILHDTLLCIFMIYRGGTGAC